MDELIDRELYYIFYNSTLFNRKMSYGKMIRLSRFIDFGLSKKIKYDVYETIVFDLEVDEYICRPF